ncbi:hypothetical protein [Streptomyces sp. NPDC006879]|uniref:hypothetical protein n=1 Tax=Streptomyces sp. NPDC006879 TaxID=3364767 RepID=UPI003686F5B1
MAWGVFATAFGWIVATDFRGAAHRFHALSLAVLPFGGAGVPVVGVGFFRLLAGVFALAGPAVLASGLLDVWRGGAGSDGLSPVPLWSVAVEAAVVGVLFWRAWRRSGVLRREWDAGHGPRRAAVAGLTTAVVVFVVVWGFGWGAWALASWLAGGLCGIFLLLGDRPGGSPTGVAASAGSSDS